MFLVNIINFFKNNEPDAIIAFKYQFTVNFIGSILNLDTLI
jgi:hypothetical protein